MSYEVQLVVCDVADKLFVNQSTLCSIWSTMMKRGFFLIQFEFQISKMPLWPSLTILKLFCMTFHDLQILHVEAAISLMSANSKLCSFLSLKIIVLLKSNSQQTFSTFQGMHLCFTFPLWTVSTSYCEIKLNKYHKYLLLLKDWSSLNFFFFL
jgi:hypothetical protein